MASSAREENGTMSARLLDQLSLTPYACSALTPMSTRPANFVYRGTLRVPIHIKGKQADSVIVKHSTDALHAEFDVNGNRLVFEELLLQSIASLAPLSTVKAQVATPRLLLFDHKTNTQVLQDFTETQGLFLSINANLNWDISGYCLGSWLLSFHSWTSAREQAFLLSHSRQKDETRALKYSYTYAVILSVLENYPHLLASHRETLEAIQSAMIAELERRPDETPDDSWGIIHGDLWSGNILVPACKPEGDSLSDLYVIDWEFAQFGHRSSDLGQILGDFYERKVFRSATTPTNMDSVMEGIIRGYGALSEDMAFRTAMYIGVHLVGWYHRKSAAARSRVNGDVIVAGLALGRDFILKGWQKDKQYFHGSELALLFEGEDHLESK